MGTIEPYPAFPPCNNNSPVLFVVRSSRNLNAIRTYSIRAVCLRRPSSRTLKRMPGNYEKIFMLSVFPLRLFPFNCRSGVGRNFDFFVRIPISPLESKRLNDRQLLVTREKGTRPGLESKEIPFEMSSGRPATSCRNGERCLSVKVIAKLQFRNANYPL